MQRPTIYLYTDGACSGNPGPGGYGVVLRCGDYEKEMSRIQKEMQDIMKQEKESQTMLEDAFKGIGYGID